MYVDIRCDSSTKAQRTNLLRTHVGAVHTDGETTGREPTDTYQQGENSFVSITHNAITASVISISVHTMHGKSPWQGERVGVNKREGVGRQCVLGTALLHNCDHPVQVNTNAGNRTTLDEIVIENLAVTARVPNVQTHER
jgi:hypothetical protein